MIPVKVRTSTLKKSIAAIASQRAPRKVLQGVPVLIRSGAGSIPWPLSIRFTVFRSTVIPRLCKASLIRVYPHDWFSSAISRTRSAISSRFRGRPRPRLAVPSYFLATRFLNQRRSVSGVTIPANCSSVFRPRALAFALNLRLCLSVNRSRQPLQIS